MAYRLTKDGQFQNTCGWYCAWDLGYIRGVLLHDDILAGGKVLLNNPVVPGVVYVPIAAAFDYVSGGVDYTTGLGGEIQIVGVTASVIGTAVIEGPGSRLVNGELAPGTCERESPALHVNIGGGVSGGHANSKLTVHVLYLMV